MFVESIFSVDTVLKRQAISSTKQYSCQYSHYFETTPILQVYVSQYNVHALNCGELHFTDKEICN